MPFGASVAGLLASLTSLRTAGWRGADAVVLGSRQPLSGRWDSDCFCVVCHSTIAARTRWPRRLGPAGDIREV